MLVIIGGMHYAIDLSVSVVSGLLIAIIVLFIIICLKCSADTQLFYAKLFTLLFAFIMGAVVVGVASEIADEFNPDSSVAPTSSTTTTTNPFNPPGHFAGLANASSSYELSQALLASGGAAVIDGVEVSVSTVYLGGLIAMFLIAGLLHLREAYNLVHGTVYACNVVVRCTPDVYIYQSAFKSIQCGSDRQKDETEI